MATGMFNASLNPTDFNKKSYAAALIRLFPNGSAPLFAISALMGTKTALQFEHGYYSKTMVFPSVTLDGELTGGVATTVTVLSTANILRGDQLRAQSTGEIVVVDSITDATTLEVTRGVGVVSAGTIATAVVLYKVGNAFEEGSVRPANLYILPVRSTNFPQIFRNAWQLTGTAAATQVIVGNGNVAENRQDAMMFHAVDIEYAILFGQKFLGTRNNQPFHTMDGLVSRISQDAAGNIVPLGSTTTFTELEAALDPMFNVATDPKSSMNRIGFVGGTALRVINNIGRLNGTYNLVDGQTNYGLRFKTLTLARGSIDLIEHPLLNTNATWAKSGIFVDPASFNLAYLGGRKTIVEEYNINGRPTDNGIDAVGGSLLTELTTEITNPQANAYLTNFTAAAVG
jgi:hypothetical protein